MDLIGVVLLLLVIDIVYYSSHFLLRGVAAMAEMTAQEVLSAALLHFNGSLWF